MQDKRHAEAAREENKHGGMIERVLNDDKLSPPHSKEQNASAASARTLFLNFKETFSAIQRKGVYCVSRALTTKRK